MPTRETPLLAVDVGTSAVKCGVIAADGRARIAAQPVAAAVTGDGRHEVDPRTWLRAVASCVAELQLPDRLAAVVVTGNGPTVVPAGTDGEPLGNAITWLDGRSTAEAAQIAERSGDQRAASFFLAKIYWLYRHQRALYEQARGFVSGPEYVELRLTGHWHTNLAVAGFQPLYWNDALVAELQMEPRKLPPFVATGTPVGTVTAAAAGATGIPRDTPVIAGAPDFVMAVLGSGAVSAGDTCNRAGSSDGLIHCATDAVSDPRLLSLPHIVGPLHTVSGLISTTGRALEWFRSVVGGDDALYEQAARLAPGAAGVVFLPYLAGERTPLWRSDVRGGFSGLALEHGRGEMARAVLEAVGYALRDSLEILEASGCAIAAIRLAGARAATPWLNRIKADILGRTLLVPEVLDAELIGCAAVGWCASGRFRDLATAARQLTRVAERVEPKPETAAAYAAGFARYRHAQQLLAATAGGD